MELIDLSGISWSTSTTALKCLKENFEDDARMNRKPMERLQSWSN